MTSFIPGLFRQTIYWLAIALTLLLVACQNKPVKQAYEGPAKADDEVATLIIPEAFNLMFIDKRESGSLFSGDGATIKILPGSHEVIIKYQDYWDLQTSDDHERTESKPMKIVFDASAGQKYRVSFEKPENVMQARSYAENPKVEIIDATSNKAIAANITYNLYTQGVIAGMIIRENQVEDDQPSDMQLSDKQATTSASIPVATPMMAAPSSPSASTGAANDTGANKGTGANGRALEMLKYWWETASDEQKKAFQEWTTK